MRVTQIREVSDAYRRSRLRRLLAPSAVRVPCTSSLLVAADAGIVPTVSVVLGSDSGASAKYEMVGIREAAQLSRDARIWLLRTAQQDVMRKSCRWLAMEMMERPKVAKSDYHWDRPLSDSTRTVSVRHA